MVITWDCYACMLIKMYQQKVCCGVVQVVGLSAARVRSFVLDNDPVPRAMLSVDPTFALLRNAAPVSWLLEARRRLLGAGAALTPERFLFENVGGVYLIRWSPESGQKVFPPPEHSQGVPPYHDACCWYAGV